MLSAINYYSQLFGPSIVGIGSVLFTGLVVLIKGVNGSSGPVKSVHALLGQAVPQIDLWLDPLVRDHGLPRGRGVSVPSSRPVDPPTRLKI